MTEYEIIYKYGYKTKRQNKKKALRDAENTLEALFKDIKYGAITSKGLFDITVKEVKKK